MVSWAESFACRRKGLLGYFGESYTKENCGLCDNCLHQEEKQVDITLPAQKFLSCVVRTNERFGVGHIIKVLRGSRSKDVLKWSHDKVTTYGIGQEYAVETWKHLAQQFLRLGLLKQTTGTGSLKVTEKGWAVCNGERVWGTLAEAEEAAVSNEPMTYNAELFARLRILRKELADAEGVPPYIIFADRSLQEMAAYYPQSTAAFSQLHGVGQMKLEKYAAHFLALIGDFCIQHQLPEKQPNTAVIVAPSIKRHSQEISEYLRSGHTIRQLQPRAIPIKKTQNTYSVEEIRQDFPKAYEHWAVEDDDRLKEHFVSGSTIQELAKYFQRKEGAIRSRLRKLGLLV